MLSWECYIRAVIACQSDKWAFGGHKKRDKTTQMPPWWAHWHDLPLTSMSNWGRGKCSGGTTKLAARLLLTREIFLQDSESIRNAVLRYGITHPVVNDGDMAMWRSMGAASWPTFAVLSPQVSSSDVKCCPVPLP